MSKSFKIFLLLLALFLYYVTILSVLLTRWPVALRGSLLGPIIGVAMLLLPLLVIGIWLIAGATKPTIKIVSIFIVVTNLIALLLIYAPPFMISFSPGEGYSLNSFMFSPIWHQFFGRLFEGSFPVYNACVSIALIVLASLMLKLNKTARKIFLFFQYTIIFYGLGDAYFNFFIKFSIPLAVSLSFAFFEFIKLLTVYCLFPLLYIIFLMLPKVKEQFKQEKGVNSL